ncbi:nicotinate-nucleotide--dimethylbenzimidazole phosphoribosyltransferase [Streptomyces sp. SL13]|uniref:Nicotinate-nucleotide--dimethylbenzimidazole phosphoribosyltransferase n=1 Tax=Streptantibioticus silvisoli TaxID=2705255 RepID=A0AA90HD64_9ACTN|nr:nicotinate-nucleotide--dimethylbenzimidazole phosphoribosyltransferase [Streptantibioticus silvisoli]MDI5973565.1 nicotinate-nucleotide--dimethylbenzimidazole phosphoribosyltransferase [Streptantibioticus silvisoli]
MTDTGPVPGEGLPESAGTEAVRPPHAGQPGEAVAAAAHGHHWSTDAFLAPATPAFTFLDQPEPADAAAPPGEYEDEELLMPGPQGGWADPQFVPPPSAPQHAAPQPPSPEHLMPPQPVEYPAPVADGIPAAPAEGYPAEGYPVEGYPAEGYPAQTYAAVPDAFPQAPEPFAPPAEPAMEHVGLEPLVPAQAAPPTVPMPDPAAGPPPVPEAPAQDAAAVAEPGAAWVPEPAAPADQAPPPRRPLNLGPPQAPGTPRESTSGVSVRSLADRGPTPAPAPPAPPFAEPVVIPGQQTTDAPLPGAGWGTPDDAAAVPESPQPVPADEPGGLADLDRDPLQAVAEPSPAPEAAADPAAELPQPQPAPEAPEALAAPEAAEASEIPEASAVPEASGVPEALVAEPAPAADPAAAPAEAEAATPAVEQEAVAAPEQPEAVPEAAAEVADVPEADVPVADVADAGAQVADVQVPAAEVLNAEAPAAEVLNAEAPAAEVAEAQPADAEEPAAEAAAVDPAPAGPAVVDPAAVEPAAGEAVPAEAVAVDPAPVGTVPAEEEPAPEVATPADAGPVAEPEALPVAEAAPLPEVASAPEAVPAPEAVAGVPVAAPAEVPAPGEATPVDWAPVDVVQLAPAPLPEAEPQEVAEPEAVAEAVAEPVAEPAPEPVAEIPAEVPAEAPAPEAAVPEAAVPDAEPMPEPVAVDGAAPEPDAAPVPEDAAPEADAAPAPGAEAGAEPVAEADAPEPVAEALPDEVPAAAPQDPQDAAPVTNAEPVAEAGTVAEATEPSPAAESPAAEDLVTEAPATDAPATEAPAADGEPAAEIAADDPSGTGADAGPQAAVAETVETTAEPVAAPVEAEAEAEVAEPVAAPQGPPSPGYDAAVRDAVHKVIRERRDIRNGFRPDPIPHEVLLRVLEAAHTAPSVGHSQPWDFVVIRSEKTREKMHELAERQREAYASALPKARAKQFRELKIEAILDTPVNIVVTADPTRGGRHTLGRHTQPQMAPYSSALAVENLWLAARAEGLGVGWVSFFDEREMVRELGLPEHLEVVAYLCVGYVDEFPEDPELVQAGWSKRRPLSWVVHDEAYGNRALPGEEPHGLLDETLRGIRPLDAKALGEAWERQKRMTKPSGALGMLEIISAQLSGLSRQCPPPIPEPAVVAIFAGDHGVHAQGVTAWPQEVTGQMVANFLGGGAVCNAFANQVGAEVCVVDVGVAGELPSTPGLLPRKIRPGTDDFTVGPAMTRQDVLRAIEVGIETARDLVAAGNKVLLTGEMGIGNTTASAALIAVYTGADPAEVTGRGTGINDEMLARKVDVVRRALELHNPDPTDPIGVLAAVGGLEHAAIAGLLLGGASLRTPVILDGVSAGAAALVARAIAPEALAACIAGHRSAEPGHVAALTKLGLRPLVDLDLRLGEGTGALLALPLVQSAARVMHEVATFDAAGVTEKG